MMAINVMTLVWEHAPCKGGTLLLFLALADHAHKDGSNVYPGVPTLAEDSRMTERQVRRCLRELEQDGLITKVSEATGKPGWKNEYRIELEALKKCQGGKNVRGDIDDADGGHLEHEGGTNAPPYIDEPSLEPSLNRHSLAERGKENDSTVSEKGKVEPDPRAWSPDVMAAYRQLPNVDLAAPEAPARSQWEKIPIDERPTIVELVGCIQAYGRNLERINHGQTIKRVVRYPDTWIGDRCFDGFLADVRASQAAAPAKVPKAEKQRKVIEMLDELVVRALTQGGFSADEINAWFKGVTFEYGPPWRLGVPMQFTLQHFAEPSFRRRIERAFGGDCVVEFDKSLAA